MFWLIDRIRNHFFAPRYAPYGRRRIQSKPKVRVPMLYAFKCQPCQDCSHHKDHVDTFKVGKTINIKQRLRQYKTIDPDGVLFYTVECRQMDFAEKWLHHILTLNGHHVKQELFKVKGDHLKTFMHMAHDICKLFEDNAQDPEAMVKIAKATKILSESNVRSLQALKIGRATFKI